MAQKREQFGTRALAAAVFAAVLPAYAAGPIKIMPLGDSITHGNGGYTSYRYPLFYRLKADGYDNFTFVGTQQDTEDDTGVRARIDPATGQLAYPRYDLDFAKGNDGHSGWNTYAIAQSVAGWAQTAQPDVVLLMSGTNDLAANFNLNDVITAYTNVAMQLRTVNPNVAIVLAKLIPSAWFADSKAVQLNAMIANLPATLSTATSPFIVVDQFTGFDKTNYTFDGTHTNIAGAQFMSNNWAPALEGLLGPAPTVTSASWMGVSGSLWNNNTNWSTRTPHVPGDTATFAAAAGQQTVHLDSVRTAGFVVFGNAAGTLGAGWTIDNNAVASDVLTLATPSGVPTITVNTLANGNAATISAVIAGTQGIVKNGAGKLILSGSNTYSGGTTVNGGTLVFASAGARPAGSKLTLNKNASTGQGSLVVVQGDAANIAAYRSALAASFVNGLWTNGGAIASSDAAAASGEGIGFLTGAFYNLLHGGTTYAATDLVLKYTLLGDATLDGRIGMDDYSQLEAGFLLHTPSPTWGNGDFNYDGVVNYKDYALIDYAFMHQSGNTLANDLITEHAGAFGTPYANALADLSAGVVPEPASLGLLVLGTMALLRRSPGKS